MLLRAEVLGPWVDRQSRVANNLLSVTDGHGGLVAVGEGVILNSPDGVNWTKVWDFNGRLRGVAYGNGVYVAVGDYLLVARSYDGVNWQQLPATVRINNQWFSITFADGRFIKVGDWGTIGLSLDGYDWGHMRNSAASLRSVAGGIVAVGVGGAVYTTDGASLPTRQPDVPSASRIGPVFRGPDGWVLIGEDPNVIYSSEDMRCWTPRYSAANIDMNGIAFGRGRYLIVGDRGFGLTSTAKEGPWHVLPWAQGTMRAATFARGSFFAVGDNGYIAERVFAETTLFHFELQPADAAGVSGESAAFIARAISEDPIDYQWFRNGSAIPGATTAALRFDGLQPGDEGAYRLRAISGGRTLFSRDAHLRIVSPAVSITHPTEGAIIDAEAPHRLVAIAFPEHSFRSVAFYSGASPIGRSFAPPFTLDANLQPGRSYEIRAVARTHAGINVTSAPVRFQVSVPFSHHPLSQTVLLGRTVEFEVGSFQTEQSIQWTKDHVPIPGATSRTLTVVADTLDKQGDYRARIVNQAGLGESRPGRLTILQNGPNFHDAFWHPFPNRLAQLDSAWSVARGNGITLAVGGNGRLVATRDHQTWRSLAPPGYPPLGFIKFLNGKFWGIAYPTGGVFSSANGLSWEPITTGPYREIVYENGVYFLVGDVCARSFDGRVWQQQPRPTGLNLQSVAVGNGRFVASSPLDRFAVSTDALNWTVTTIPDAEYGEAYSVTFFNGRFFLHRARGLMTSVDGLNWSRFFPGEFRSVMGCDAFLLFSIDGSMREFFRVGRDGRFSRVQATSSLLAPNSPLSLGDQLMITGRTLSGNGQATEITSDGIHWTRLSPSMELPALPTLSAAAGKVYLGGSDTWLPVVGADGRWDATLNHTLLRRLGGVAFGADTVIAINSLGDIFRSGDGMAFQALGLNLSGATNIKRIGHEFIAYGGTSLYRSASGAQFSAVAIPEAPVSVAKAVDGILYASRGGALLHLDDAGATQTHFDGRDIYRAVAFGAGRTVAVGTRLLHAERRLELRAGRVVGGAVAGRLQLWDVAFADGMFLAVGGGGRVAYSWDGINWELDTLRTSAELRAVAHANGRWFVAGEDGALLQTGLWPDARLHNLTARIDANGAAFSAEATPGSIVRVEQAEVLEPDAWRPFEMRLAGEAPERWTTPVNDTAAGFFRARAE